MNTFATPNTVAAPNSLVGQSTTTRPNSCVWKARLERTQISPLARIASQARILSGSDLAEAHEIAETLKQPVDQVLLTSGFLQEEIAKMCTRALAFVEDGICAEYLVVQGLMIAIKKQLSFEDGLRYYGWGW